MKYNFIKNAIISVIIPTYNSEKFISKCIQSVLNQHYQKLEIIIVDDYSDDNSLLQTKLALQNSKIPWKIFKHEKNKGVSAARNTGVNNSIGEYLFFLDSDDYLDPLCLSKLYNTAKLTNSDMVLGTMMDVTNEGKPMRFTKKQNNETFNNPIIAYVENKLSNLSCNRLINHLFYLKSGINFIEGIIFEDNVWSFSTTAQATRVSTISDTTYYYRKWEGSFMSCKSYDSFRLDCLYYDLCNCNNIAQKININSHPSFRLWFARAILNYFEKITNANVSQKERTKRLSKFFSEISIPENELNKITCFWYIILKTISILFPNHIWINILIKIRKFKTLICKVNSQPTTL